MALHSDAKGSIDVPWQFLPGGQELRNDNNCKKASTVSSITCTKYMSKNENMDSVYRSECGLGLLLLN